jgi:tRNA (guanine37-N1)-methyltransferase
MRIDFVTLFPDQIRQALGHSITLRARERGLYDTQVANPRDFATDSHKTVDDKPYGGGPGMVMIAELVDQALQSLQPIPGAAVVVTDPTGERFTQGHAATLAKLGQVIFVCGHYEGIDERFAMLRATHRFSIGDYVLTGGEMPALVMADAIIRLLPGALGAAESLDIDSHHDGLLSAPQFTRPEVWQGLAVPPELTGGNHGDAAKWKRKQALRSTRSHRPDLFSTARLEKSDLDLLQ